MEGAVRQGLLHQIEPLVVVEDAPHQRGDMRVFVIPGRQLKKFEDSFELGILMLLQRHSRQAFDHS